jgi:hypothetical protein
MDAVHLLHGRREGTSVNIGDPLVGFNPLLNGGTAQPYGTTPPLGGLDPAALGSMNRPAVPPSERLKSLLDDINGNKKPSRSTKATLSNRRAVLESPRSVYSGKLRKVAGGGLTGSPAKVVEQLRKHRGEVIVKNPDGVAVYAYERGPDGEWRGFSAVGGGPLPPGIPDSPELLVSQFATSPQAMKFTMYIVENGKERLDRLDPSHTVRSTSWRYDDPNGNRYVASSSAPRGAGSVPQDAPPSPSSALSTPIEAR